MREHNGLTATPVLEKNLDAVFGRDRVMGIHKGSGVASDSSSGGSRGIDDYGAGIFAINAETMALIAKPPKISHPNNSAASASGLTPALRIAET